MVNIGEILRQAVDDGVVYCPFCENGYLEPDYNKCPNCEKSNPLREGGFIWTRRTEKVSRQ